LALEPALDRLHIAYFDGFPRNDLKYAWGGAGVWRIETVDSAGNVGMHASLALAEGGWPRISYYDASNRDLKYAAYDEAGWQVQTVDTIGDVGTYTSLALDAQGSPRIAYYDETAQALRYAFWDGIAWQFQVADAAPGVGQHASLALNREGSPHISYYDAEHGNLKYAAWDGQAWHTQVVDGQDNVGMYSSLVLDRQGLPRIAYYDARSGDLKYAFWDGAAWQMQLVDSAGDVGVYASLELHPLNGNPQISYYDSSRGDLKYAEWTGRAWDVRTVESAGQLGRYPSAALDPRGILHIVYFDDISGAWLRILQLAFPIVAVLTAVPLLAAHFLRTFYGMESLNESHTYLHRTALGLRGRRPVLQVEEGQITRGRRSTVARLGGPGHLLVYNDSAVVLEQGGRLTRVVKPGFHALKRFERVWETVDLRPQYWVVEVEAITRDGIPVTCKADITFKIDGDNQAPTDKMPHPYSEKAVFAAATSTWVCDPDRDPWKMIWTARVAGEAEGILRQIISDYRLDGLIGTTSAGGDHPRKEIQGALKKQLHRSVKDLGVEVLQVELGEFRLDPRVSQQWIQAWQAIWRREATLEHAQGEARLAQLEVSQVQARLEVILTLTQALQHLVDVQHQASFYHIAMRLVETLRWMSFDPVTRASMSPRAIRSLKYLQDSLGSGQPVQKNQRSAKADGEEDRA
jgi:regulator of protease activity HflC (stomatin/prohibitin superfamily)